MIEHRLAERVHRALLWLYPSRFRRTYSRELHQAFRVRLHRRASWLSFWIQTVTDVAWNAVAVRMQSRHERHIPVKRRRPHVMFTAQDIKFSIRLLRRQPIFTTVVIFTLALGVGANTALFTVLKGVLLAPLPYASPDELVRVWENDVNEGRPHGNLSPADFLDYQSQSQTLESLGAFSTGSAIVHTESEPERISVQGFTVEVFDLLGVAPLVGRTFRMGDEARNGGRWTVLSHGFWQRSFGGDSSVVGTGMRIGSNTYEVIGVMPREFRPFHGAPELWVLNDFDEGERTERRVHYIRAIGRVKAGRSLLDVRSDLLAIANRLEIDYPGDNTGHLVTVESLEESIVGNVRGGLWFLMAVVGFVLLIACVNLANLFLSRGAGRQRELALRSALGAGRRRLIVQLMTENAVLGTMGALAGLGLSYICVKAFLALDPGTLPRIDLVRTDLQSLIFAMTVAMVTAVLFGLMPSIVASRRSPASTLKQSGSSVTTGPAVRRLRDGLVIVQLAMAITLLVGAGLLFRSLAQLQSVDPGFDSEGLLVGQISLPGRRYPNNEDVALFQRTLFERLDRSPEVNRSGSVTSLPFTNESATSWLTILGREPTGNVPPEVSLINVSGGNYFRTIGVSLVSGRLFDDRDHLTSTRVTVINEAAQREHWPNEDPIGQRIRLGPNPEAVPYEIIGVVSDVRQFGLDQSPRPASFTLSRQAAWWGFWIVLDASSDPRTLIGFLKDQVRLLDPELVISNLTTMEDLISASTARPRFATWLVGAFAAFALCIAAVGVYGVMAYTVTQRTHEIGLRLALGAGKGGVMKLVLGKGLVLAGLGTGIGLASAAAMASALRSQLFEISALDPMTFVLVPILLVATALAASYLPAARAAKLDPVGALKSE